MLTRRRRDIEVHTNVLLDKGSETSLIPKDIADKLKLTGKRRTMNISPEVINFMIK